MSESDLEELISSLPNPVQRHCRLALDRRGRMGIGAEDENTAISVAQKLGNVSGVDPPDWRASVAAKWRSEWR